MKVGLYELEYLAQGGTSQVYRGRRAGRNYFVKQVSQRDEDSCRLLRNEYTHLSRLRHPGIVQAFEWLEEGDDVYLVQQFVAGQPLSQGRYAEAQVVDFGLQLCDILSYLHSRTPSLIYRDLKPGNVLCGPNGRLTLIDFGMARTYKPGQARDTVPLGTPTTASPEHFSGQTDARSDVYTLGATLHILLRPPDFVPQLFTYPPVRSLNPAVSAGLETIITRCTQRDPARRYADARQVAQALKALAPQQRPAPAPGSRRRPVSVASRVLFCRQLDLLFRGGVPLARCVETLARQTEDASLREILQQMSGWLQAGVPLSGCFAACPESFPPVYPALCKIGENSGSLSRCLDHLAHWGEREQTTARKVRAALAYPVLVLSMTGLLTLLMCAFVLPSFLPIFSEMGVPLPLLTRIVLEAAVLTHKPGAWIAAAGLFYGLRDGLLQLWRSTRVRLPLLGPIFRLHHMVRFFSSLQLLLAGGVRLDEGLPMACQASDDPLLGERQSALVEAIRGGSNLRQTLRQNEDLFTRQEIGMLSAGEESGRLEITLGQLARIAEEELDYRLDVFAASLEPALMAFLAVVVGTIVVAMFLPLYGFLARMS